MDLSRLKFGDFCDECQTGDGHDVGRHSRSIVSAHHGNNLPSVTPNPREVRGQSQSLAKPVEEASTDADSHEVRPSTSVVSATGAMPATARSEAMLTPVSELAALQSTVTELAGQMAWFVQRLIEDDVAMSVNEEAGDGLAIDSPPVDIGPTPTDNFMVLRRTSFAHWLTNVRFGMVWKYTRDGQTMRDQSKISDFHSKSYIVWQSRWLSDLFS